MEYLTNKNGFLGIDNKFNFKEKVVIVPFGLEKTVSYGGGTKNGPKEIIKASHQVELYDEELNCEPYKKIGIKTLKPFKIDKNIKKALKKMSDVNEKILNKKLFPMTFGGEHSITPGCIAPFVKRHKNLCLLHFDAHADLRESYMGSRLSHACAMRRSLEYARCTQVGIRSMSQEEAEIVPSLNTTIFFDVNMRQRTDWMNDVVKSLGQHVYITIDCDGLEPGTMPAVGTPEPGGLSWMELLGLLRAVFSQREVIACDVVELCPIPGVIHPNFLCAKLVYKLLTYKFAQLD